VYTGVYEGASLQDAMELLELVAKALA